MNKSERVKSPIGSHLDEIRELEDKLIGLKRQFLERSSAFLESLVDENGTIPFLIATALGHHFAIPVSVVEEVIEMVGVTPVCSLNRATPALISERMSLAISRPSRRIAVISSLLLAFCYKSEALGMGRPRIAGYGPG